MKRLLLVVLWATALPCWAGEHESHGGGLIQGMMEFQIVLVEVSHAALSADVLNASPYFIQMTDEFWSKCEFHAVQGRRSQIVADRRQGCHLYFSLRDWTSLRTSENKWMNVCELVLEATRSSVRIGWCSKLKRRPIVPAPEYL